MVNEKFKDVKFNFPKDPMNTEFIKIWQETIEREDFKNLKKQVLKEEFEAYMNELVDKAIPKRPDRQYEIDWGMGNAGECSDCKNLVNYQNSYCGKCGQKLDWSDRSE